MREILFRGKTPDDHWTYGYYEDEKASSVDFPAIVPVRGSYCNLSYRVIPETVGQYIGLKDKNGQKIFEGDIISIPGSKKQGLPAPVYYMDGFQNPEFVIRRNGYTPMCLTNVEERGEVVGNIWDNPELLKED